MTSRADGIISAGAEHASGSLILTWTLLIHHRGHLRHSCWIRLHSWQTAHFLCHDQNAIGKLSTCQGGFFFVGFRALFNLKLLAYAIMRSESQENGPPDDSKENDPLRG